MEDVIDKTKKLILSFEESSLITNLDHYKSLICQNKKLLEQINKFNSSSDDYEKIALKKEIYKNDEYRMFMKYYMQLFYYILEINKKFKSYTNTSGCNKWE